MRAARVAPMALTLLVVAFAGCQGSAARGEIEGRAWVGPSCPVESDPPDPDCEDQPYEGELALTAKDGDRVIRYFGTDEAGGFTISVPAGTYQIRSAAQDSLPNCSTQEPVVVEAGNKTEVTVQCDSGIR